MPIRMWTDVTGKYKTEAAFDGVTPEGKVRMKQPTGRILEVPLEKFSAESRAELEKLLKTMPAPNTTQIELQDDPRPKEIAALEKKLQDSPNQFDWNVHNSLRHLYSGHDDRKALYHCNIIFENSPSDGYILTVLGTRDAEHRIEQAVKDLLSWPEKYPEYTFVSAACWLRAAELLSDEPARCKELLQKIIDLKGDGLDKYRTAAAAKLEALKHP